MLATQHGPVSSMIDQRKDQCIGDERVMVTANRKREQAISEEATSHVSSLKQIAPGIFELIGFAYTTTKNALFTVEQVRAISPGQPEIVSCVQPLHDDMINISARDAKRDRSTTGFSCRLDMSSVLPSLPGKLFDKIWNIELRVRVDFDDTGESLHNWIPFKSKSGSGAVQLNCAEYISSSVLTQARWKSGLEINITRKAAVGYDYYFDKSCVVVIFKTYYFEPDRIQVKIGDEILTESPVQRYSDELLMVRIEIDALDIELSPAYFVLVEPGGRNRMLHYSPLLNPHCEAIPGVENLFIVRTPRSVFRLDRKRSPLILDSAQLAGEGTLILSGWWSGGADGDTLQLCGPYSDLAVEVTKHSGTGRFSGTVALPSAKIGSRRGYAARTGRYILQVKDIGGDLSSAAEASTLFIRNAGRRDLARDINVEVGVGSNNVAYIHIYPPLSDGERSLFGRRVAQLQYRDSDTQADLVLFETFHGRSIGDNTLPIFDRLKNQVPSLRPFWTVADYSVEVPDGAEPVIVHSNEYYRILSKSRLHVTNNWLPAEIGSRSGRTILQTWHGTPLKQLGLDRFGMDSATRRERMRASTLAWDGLISQNPYSTEIFRRCYAYDGPVYEFGYPRNDVLSNGIGSQAVDQIRTRLGIQKDSNILLYMPTWREDRKQMVDALDLSVLQTRLGSNWAILVRGHSMNTKHGRSSLPADIIDVSLFPDPALLYLLADVFVTDYSSAMFDFSVTGKPMVFFVPDLDVYKSKLRGVYFDLEELAPGPLLKTTESVIDHVINIEEASQGYCEKYSNWIQRFNPWDDGGATARITEELVKTL